MKGTDGKKELNRYPVDGASTFVPLGTWFKSGGKTMVFTGAGYEDAYFDELTSVSNIYLFALPPINHGSVNGLNGDGFVPADAGSTKTLVVELDTSKNIHAVVGDIPDGIFFYITDN